jgi:hypothetical protein
VLHLLDLPPVGPDDGDRRPLVAAAGEPWRPVEVLAGTSAAALSVRARAAAPATVGVTLTELRRGPLHRLSAATLTVHVEGDVLASRSFQEVAAGQNALAVLTPAGEWEIVQFLGAELLAPDTYRLSGLLRGQAGSDPAMADVTPAGASVVLLDADLVRAEVGAWERGAPLLWRAAAGPEASTDGTFTWRGVADRPWSPAGLRAKRLAGGGLRLSWVRRARIDGDEWEGEPPLSEEREGYRLEVLDGEAVVRVWETAGPVAVYPAGALAGDFPDGPPNPLRVRVRQWSGVFGWGAPALRDLWL